MKYADFEAAISPKRISRYLMACNGDSRKAMTLYRYNLRVCQEMFSIVCCFEVSLRNKFDFMRYPVCGNDSFSNGFL